MFAVMSFTEAGMQLSLSVKQKMEKNNTIGLYTKCSMQRNTVSDAVQYVEEPLAQWTGKQFATGNTMLFIGATQIAVRAIAPFVKDKLTDPPVIVMDEEGRFVIPVLSGHVGGANELAVTLAQQMQATPVITTATDIRQKFAIDVFAKKNRLTIRNRTGIARVSSRILAGQTIRIGVDDGYAIKGRIPSQVEVVRCDEKEVSDRQIDVYIGNQKQITGPATGQEGLLLHLSPKEYAVGIGCRRGISQSVIYGMLKEVLDKLSLREDDIFTFASVDRKKDEQGICNLSRSCQIPFETFPVEILQTVPGAYTASAFVKSQIGVDNVCERAAMAACGKNAVLVLEKQAHDGVTMAVAKSHNKSFTF